MNTRQALAQMKGFLRDESGLELSEYAVATAMISLAVAAVFTSLGSKIGAAIGALEGKIVTS